MSQRHIPNDAFTQTLQTIRQQIADGRLQEAAQALNAAQAQRPRDARIALLGMRLAEKAHNWPAAEQAARRAVALEPHWPVALMELALVLARHVKTSAEEALRLASTAVQQDPRDVQVLRTAVVVASLTEHREQAVAWARQALALTPDDMQLQLVLAQRLLELGDLPASRQAYERVLSRQPGDYAARLGMVSLLMQSGEKDQAKALVEALRQDHPHDDEVLYWHGVINEQLQQIPGSVVSAMFDEHAAWFDTHLVAGLQYRAPQMAAERLLALYPDRTFNLLDLGCGTGLLGMCLGPIRGYMIGVDLSEKMIEQAARRQVYARFHQVNVLDALRETPGEHYEAIACLDTLVYVGDLAPVIPNAWRILKPGGCFIFTCESAAENEDDMVLRASGRFAHKASFVEKLCSQAGFGDVRLETLPTLRTEGGQPLEGFMVTARKPGHPAG